MTPASTEGVAAAPVPPRSRLALAGVVVVLLLGTALRLVYLDADPSSDAWVGFIIDEGRWVENARSLVLFGDMFEYGRNLHFYLAPLFQLAVIPPLALLGVSLWSARLFSAVCGCGLLLLIWLSLRGTVRPVALLIGLALLATQADLIMLSRVAVPEMAALLVETAVVLLLVTGRLTRSRAALAGALTLLGIGLKATMLPMVPIFALIVLAVPRGARSDAAARGRIADACAYLVVCLAPIVLVVAIALLRSPSGEGARWALDAAFGFLRPAGPFSLLSFPFTSLLAPTFVPWSVGAWLAGLAAWAVGRPQVDRRLRRLLIGAGVWCGGLTLTMVTLEYYPHRYRAHVLVPLALLAIVAAELLATVGVTRIVDALARIRRQARLLAAIYGGLGTAVVVSPALLAVFSSLGLDSERVRSKLTALLAAWSIVVVVAVAAAARRSLWRTLVLAPPIFAFAWLLARLAGIGTPFWAPGAPLERLLAWSSLALPVGVVAAAACLPEFDRWLPARGTTLCAVWAYIAVSALAVAPYYADPQFTMREISRDLGRILIAAESVTTHQTEGLFLGNAVRFRSDYRIDPLREKSEYFVVARKQTMFRLFRKMLAAEYELVRSYEVWTSPGYRENYPPEDGEGEAGERILVYRRAASAAGGPEQPP